MIFWKRELRDLSDSQHRFEDVFRIFTDEFTDRVFSEQYQGGRTIRTTYTEIKENAARIGRVLHARFGGQEGAFLAIRMENSPLWVSTFFGVLQAGFRPLLLNLRQDEETLRKVVAMAGAAAVLTDHACDGCVDLSDCGDGPAFTPCWADEIALMSSGTTGLPKLIIYNGKAITAQLLQTTDILKRCPAIKHDRKVQGIRILAFLPFYHIFGLMAVLFWFSYFGATFIFLESYDAKTIQFTCKYGRVTHFFAVPTVWDMTTDHLLREAKRQGRLEKLQKGLRLSNRLQNLFPRFGGWIARNILFKDVRAQVLGSTVMFCISGGGFIKKESLELMNGLGYGLRNGYGMTETGIISVELSSRAGKRNSGTVGQPLSAARGRFRIGSDGVLELNAPLLYAAQIVDGKRIERKEEEWFRTNDSFTMDKTGRWYISGRRDDLIIGANGENLCPDLIEQRLKITGATMYCVVGMELEGDQRPVLILQVPSVSDEYACALAARSAFDAIDALPLTQRPARVFLTEQEIPNGFGKVRRTLLLRNLAAGEISLRPAVSVSDKELEILEDDSMKELIAELCVLLGETIGQDGLTADTHVLNDLGVDSMTYYNIFSAVSERYAIDLKMDGAHPLFTPRDFAGAVLAARGNRE